MRPAQSARPTAESNRAGTASWAAARPALSALLWLGGFAALLPAVAAAEPTTITLGARTLPLAPLGPVNPWPRFRFQLRSSPVRVADSLSAEDRAGMFRTPSGRRCPI